MSLKVHIADPSTGLEATVVNKAEENALVVATRELKEFTSKTSFFTNDTYGVNMNQDVTFGGAPEEIHDGIDNVYWAASVITGDKFTFNSTDQNHTGGGSKSIKTDNAAVGDVAQIAKGSNLDLGGYLALSLWIYVDKDWKVGDSIKIYGWNTGTGTQVGLSVNFEDYFSWGNFDVWQGIIIPLNDMGLTNETIDAIRYEIVTAEGKSPKFYLDDIQIEQSGGTGGQIIYTLKPLKETWLHITEVKLSMSDNVASTVADGTMPGLSYDKFLGVTPTAGLLYQRIQNGEVQFSLNLMNIGEWLELTGTSLESAISDGTNTFITAKFKFAYPEILKAENQDELRFIVQDDFSDLLSFKVAAAGKEEARI